MGQLNAPFQPPAPLPAFEELIEDLEDLPPQSPIKQALLFVAGSLGFMALASLALWSGFQYEAHRRYRVLEQQSLAEFQLEDLPPETRPSDTAVVGEPSKTLKTMPQAVAPAPEPAATLAPPPPQAPPVPHAVAPVDLPSAIRLVGVIADAGSNLQALLMVDNILLPLGAGEPVDGGWYVVSVQQERVVLSNGSRSHTLQLGLTGQL